MGNGVEARVNALSGEARDVWVDLNYRVAAAPFEGVRVEVSRDAGTDVL